MSEFLLVVFGFIVGILFNKAINYKDEKSAYKKGVRYGFETGLSHSKAIELSFQSLPEQHIAEARVKCMIDIPNEIR
jgi:hypothetical protein